MIRIPRLPWAEFFMLHAHLAATRSTCDRGPELLLDPGRHGVGAVFVRADRVIASGFNGSPPGEPHCDEAVCQNPKCWQDILYRTNSEAKPGDDCPRCKTPLVGGHLIVENHCRRTLHAEENALLQCALDGVSPAGAVVFTTASPCYDCAKRLVRVGVSRVVHGAAYGSRYGLSGEAVGLLERAGVGVEHLDVSGVLEERGER